MENVKYVLKQILVLFAGVEGPDVRIFKISDYDLN